MTTLEPRVSLVKPGHEIATRQDDDLEIRPRGWLVNRQGEPRQVVTLVTRTRQAVARQSVWLADQPVVAKSTAVGRQLPKAGGRLVIATPRGAARSVTMLADWLRDTESANLLAKHAEAGEGESYAKVAAARQGANLAGRRATVGIILLIILLISLSWWAPQVFAGLITAGIFAGTVAMVPRRELQEWLWGVAVAALLAALAWWKLPDLAAMVPQPPTWVWLALAGVAVLVFGWMGRHEDQPLMEMPHFEMSDANRPDRPTADMVIDALCRISVTGMTLAATDRVRDEIRVRAPGVGRSTRGYTIELELPPGVTASDVMEKREELAGALRRKLGCVWPSRGSDHPGHLRLFLSDVPMATAPQPAWPMADGQPIDAFDAIPLVTDQEGEWVGVEFANTHTVIAGASGFGKSVTMRHGAVAVTFDLRSRNYVFDGKISGDLDPVRKIAHAYFEGAEPDDVAEQLQALRDLEKEMRRRARFLRDLPTEERSPKVTSALATKYQHLAPIFVWFDEVQEYTEYGTKGVKEEMAIRQEFRTILTRMSRLGRSAGIFMIMASQKPDADVLPTAIMGNCSNRLCFKVTEQNHNDQVLGTGAYKAGLKATLFSTEDRGLAWLKAAGDPQVVRGWSEMVDLQTAYDLVDISYRLREAKGLLTGQAANDGIEDAEIVYDIVEDAEQAMSRNGCGKAQWGELVDMLRELRPGQYASLSDKELSAAVYRARPALRENPRDVRSGGTVRKGAYLSDLRKQESADDE